MPPGVECRGPECYPPLSLNQGSEMDIPPRFVIHETRHWFINHRVDSALPGYLMLGAKSMSPSLAALPSEALAELGGLQAMLQTTLDEHLQPRHLYIGPFRPSGGAFHPLSFHSGLSVVRGIVLERRQVQAAADVWLIARQRPPDRWRRTDALRLERVLRTP